MQSTQEETDSGENIRVQPDGLGLYETHAMFTLTLGDAREET